MSEKRYIHSVGVMEMCETLAKIHGADVQTAKIAGLLHDIAKETTEEEKLKYVEKYKISIDEIERRNTPILHGKVGALIAKERYDVSEQIQKAIEYHTETNPNMDIIAKIVYISDKVELNRKNDNYEIEYERELAKKDLDEAVLYIIETNLRRLMAKGKLIHPEILETRNKIIMEKQDKANF
jgi:predicted HD superfamily hydrolase involved in NAD metabolism